MNAMQEMVSRVLLNKRDVTILELGAADGLDSEWIYALPTSVKSYVAVEPDPDNYISLVSRMGSKPGVSCFNVAVSNTNGHAQFVRSANHTYAGSILEPAPESFKTYPTLRYHSQKIDVPTRTLDSIAEEAGVGVVDFMWCDIQGAEGLMIEGGAATLARTRYAVMEVAYPLDYVGQRSCDELLSMLSGWELVLHAGGDIVLFNRRAGV